MVYGATYYYPRARASFEGCSFEQNQAGGGGGLHINAWREMILCLKI